MMTKEQLERAARKYCELAGINPEEKVGHGAKPPRGGGFVPSILLYSKQWQLVAEELEEQERVLEAIAHGKGLAP